MTLKLANRNGTGLATEGVEIPQHAFWMATEPAPLIGMQLPGLSFPWKQFHAVGVRWIVCLCSEHPRYDPAPLRRLATTELWDLVERELPDDPEREEELIREIANSVVERIEAGEGVVVHCAGGRGRTGTVLGMALRLMGVSADEIENRLNHIHQLRGKEGWPESPWQRQVLDRTTV